MHTLYWAPATGAFAVQVVLEELGLPYEQRLAAYLMLLLWHPGRQAVLGRFPRLAAHARRLRDRPAVRRVWELHYPRGGGHPWSTWTSSSAS